MLRDDSDLFGGTAAAILTSRSADPPRRPGSNLPARTSPKPGASVARAPGVTIRDERPAPQTGIVGSGAAPSHPAPAADERDLLARCLQGESDAWDALFERHYAAAGRFVQQLGYDLTREEVEEICQELFLTVVHSLHTFRGRCQFQTWLFRIAANKARDHQQHRHAVKRGGGRVHLSLHAGAAPDQPPIDPPDAARRPDQGLIHTEDLALLDRALWQLPASAREIIALRYFADLSYDEIASCLRLHPKTVSSRLSKSLDKLEAVARELGLTFAP
jgi:RNA polymerase sigma-70 factor, ECF subfamily